MALLANTGLLIVSGIQCMCSAVSSYQSSRALCPCFRDRNEISENGLQIDTKDAFVHSWLGKHTLPSPLYVVATPTNTTGKRSKVSTIDILIYIILLTLHFVYDLTSRTFEFRKGKNGTCLEYDM